MQFFERILLILLINYPAIYPNEYRMALNFHMCA